MDKLDGQTWWVLLLQLFVSVIDINEHRPVFSQTVYSVNVSESVQVDSELLRLQAVDTDQDSKVAFSLHSARSAHSLALFKVDYQTGAITLAQPLDRYSTSP